MTALAWVVGIGVALFLVFRFPRQSAALIVVLVLCGLGIWGYFYREGTLRETERLSVVVSAGLQRGCEDPAFPISVTFKNLSQRQLMRTSFTLEGREPGHSDTAYSAYLSWDGITAPGKQTGACWSLDSYKIGARNPALLNWTAKVLSVTFE